MIKEPSDDARKYEKVLCAERDELLGKLAAGNYEFNSIKDELDGNPIINRIFVSSESTSTKSDGKPVHIVVHQQVGFEADRIHLWFQGFLEGPLDKMSPVEVFEIHASDLRQSAMQEIETHVVGRSRQEQQFVIDEAMSTPTSLIRE